MIRIYFDMEFTGLHQDATPISIGLITEGGAQFYGFFTDYDRSQVDDWLRKNVLAKVEFSEDFKKSMQSTVFADGGRSEIRRKLVSWLCAQASRKQLQGIASIQMWSDCLAYDWVLFCELWGGAQKVPSFVSYIPMDLCTLLGSAGLDPDVDREEFARLGHFSDEGAKHNSLWDAVVIRACVARAEEEIKKRRKV